jgi:hypothetical protein
LFLLESDVDKVISSSTKSLWKFCKWKLLLIIAIFIQIGTYISCVALPI